MKSRPPAGDAASGPGPVRRRLMVIGGIAALAVVLVVGVFVARDTGPASLGTAQGSGVVTPVTPATPGDGRPVPQPAPAAVDGTGVPIRLAGTDPVNGRPVDLATFRGRPVVLQIWASWCHGCNDEAPHVSTLSKRRSDIAFVGLNFRDVDSEAQGFYRRYGWTFPSIADPQGDLAFGLGLQGTPTTIFLDAEHREIGRIVGATDETEFERAIDYVVGRT